MENDLRVEMHAVRSVYRFGTRLRRWFHPREHNRNIIK